MIANDENKTTFDLGDHAIVKASFEFRGKEEKEVAVTREYLTINKKALLQFKETIEELWEEKKPEDLLEILKDVQDTAQKTLKRKLKEEESKQSRST